MFKEETKNAMKYAHEELWSRFINKKEGALYDFADLNGTAILPTADECKKAMPNAMGWSTPTEDGPFYNGFYLDALCNRHLIENTFASAEQTRLIARGLLKFAIEDGKKGFITRGFSDDGTAFYTASSDDQVFPWFYGLWRYLKSSIPTVEETITITRIMTNVATALKENAWRIPCHDPAFGYRGSFARSRIEDITRLLFILRAMYDITANSYWIEAYNRHINTDDYVYYLTNVEICAKGSDYDFYDGKMVFFPFKPDFYKSEAFSYETIRIEQALPFFTTSMVQVALRALIEMEQSAEINVYYQKGLKLSAVPAASHIVRYQGFDNDNNLPFLCNWRFLNEYWKPQNNIKTRITPQMRSYWNGIKSPRSPMKTIM